MTPEYDLELISEVLSEAECLHPELFRELSLPEVTENNFVSTDEEITDDEILGALNQYDVQIIKAVSINLSRHFNVVETMDCVYFLLVRSSAKCSFSQTNKSLAIVPCD